MAMRLAGQLPVKALQLSPIWRCNILQKYFATFAKKHLQKTALRDNLNTHNSLSISIYKVFTTLDKNKNRPWNEVLLRSFQGLLLVLYLLVRLIHFALLRINDVAL